VSPFDNDETGFLFIEEDPVPPFDKDDPVLPLGGEVLNLPFDEEDAVLLLYLAFSTGIEEVKSLSRSVCIGKGLPEVGAGGRLLSSTILSASSRLLILSLSLDINPRSILP